MHRAQFASFLLFNEEVDLGFQSRTSTPTAVQRPAIRGCVDLFPHSVLQAIMGSEEVSAASVGMWPPIVVSGSGDDGNDQSLDSVASELTSSAAGGGR